MIFRLGSSRRILLCLTACCVSESRSEAAHSPRIQAHFVRQETGALAALAKGILGESFEELGR
jgi:hypothetical protein